MRLQLDWGHAGADGKHQGQVLDSHSQASAHVGMQWNAGHWTQVDCRTDVYPMARSSVAPLDGQFVPCSAFGVPGVGEVAVTEVRGNASLPQPPPPVLLQTCHYQRKDSPVEALTLSPEPLRVCTMS